MLRVATIALALAATLSPAPAIAGNSNTTYKLVREYSGNTFFDGWSFWNDSDPTHGAVDYYNITGATQANLAGYISYSDTNATHAYLGADYENNVAMRPSVRVTTSMSWSNGGLFIADVYHTPLGTACGTWPALWLVGPDWPNGGEMDIIEGVHLDQFNSMSGHTSPKCSISNATSSKITGTITSNTCQPLDHGKDNKGCSIKAEHAMSMKATSQKSAQHPAIGTAFNQAEGGVYATLWDESGFKIWMFPRTSIPRDIMAGKPDPRNWKVKPLSQFSGSQCNYFEKFKDLSLVINTAFCGDWAGNVWNQTLSCRGKAATCAAYVQDNPADFKDSYWDIASIKVYQTTGTASVLMNGTSTKRDVSPAHKLNHIDLHARYADPAADAYAQSDLISSHSHHRRKFGYARLHARANNFWA